MNIKETKIYRVIAHLADGDVEIFPMEKEHFTSLFEAAEARKDHLSLCENIDVYCCIL